MIPATEERWKGGSTMLKEIEQAVAFVGIVVLLYQLTMASLKIFGVYG